MKPVFVSPKPTRLAAAAGLLLVLVLTSCRTPSIKEITAHGHGDNPVRAAAPATITVNIEENGADIDSRRLYLTRVRPEGGAAGSLTLAPGPVNGAVSSHVATVPADGGTVTFQPAERWHAKASVRYYTPFGTPTTSKDFEFEVIEPLNRFDFLDTEGSPRWTVHGYFKNDSLDPAIAPIALEEFPQENYPQPLAGDHAIGFRIRPFNVSGWSPNNDLWSAEFVSPALYAQNAVGGWVGVRTYQVQVRTDASGLSLQPILTFMRTQNGPGSGHISRWRMVDSGGNTVFFTLPDDDTWHTYTVDFTNAELPAGHVLSLHLRVFGRPGELAGNDGKRVLIDRFARQ
jgi:hypothetical protein